MVVSGPGVIRADRRKPTPRAEASFVPSIPGARDHHRKPRILTREVRPSSGYLFITLKGNVRAFATKTHIVRVYPRRAVEATSRNKCEARIKFVLDWLGHREGPTDILSDESVMQAPISICLMSEEHTGHGACVSDATIHGRGQAHTTGELTVTVWRARMRPK